ncbi:glycosyltransferase [soil metagenome]
MTRMKVLCVTIGSAGDVHPFVGIGIELARRGHDVAVATNGHFQSLVENAGLRFIELGKAEFYREGIKNPELWHRTKGFKRVLEWGVLPFVRPTYELIEREVAATIATGGSVTDVVVVASTLALGTRVAQEKLGVPVVTVHLAPSVFRSLVDPPVLPGLFMPRWYPMWLKRGLMNFADKRIIDPIVAPAINPLLIELGLKPASGFFNHWWHSPLRVLGLFPDWFTSPASDWPAHLRLTGFPLYDEANVSGMSDELAKFLDNGPPPIAFTAGTAMVHGQKFFAASVAAAKRLGRRAVLLTRHPEQLPASLPEGVIHASYAPFSELLPRCAALVHHGGIGTTSQALQAGIPHLIYAMAHDQPDNAARIRRLGVGDTLRPRAYRPRRVARMLDALVKDPNVKANCVKIKMRFLGTHPLEKTCDEIEAVVTPKEASPV